MILLDGCAPPQSSDLCVNSEILLPKAVRVPLDLSNPAVRRRRRQVARGVLSDSAILHNREYFW